jgi:hypothetical protein
VLPIPFLHGIVGTPIHFVYHSTLMVNKQPSIHNNRQLTPADWQQYSHGGGSQLGYAAAPLIVWGVCCELRVCTPCAANWQLLLAKQNLLPAAGADIATSGQYWQCDGQPKQLQWQMLCGGNTMRKGRV